MKKALISVALLLVIIALIPISLLISLQTRYASQVFNQLSQWTALGMQAESVRFQYPNHFSFENVSFDHSEIHYVDQFDVWFAPEWYADGRWQIASVLVDGLSLQSGMEQSPQTLLPENVQIHQLAVSNLDYADSQWSARGIQVQIKNPQWHHAQQFMPFGEIQVSVEQLYWQGEAFNQLLADLDYKAQESTIYGLSFVWRGAKVSGQAEQYPHGWSLVNVTLEGLDLTEQQMSSILAKPWQHLTSTITHINSLDILRSSLHFNGYQLVNVELSSENLTLPFDPWQQDDGVISFSADSVQEQNQVWVEPRVQLVLNPKIITVQEASAQWQQGNLLLTGSVSPERIHLEQLLINNVKWAAEYRGEGAWLRQLFAQTPTIRIDQLNIERSQFIQLVSQPYWQLSGLNIDGEQLLIKQEGQAGLWQGKVRATAVNASYQDILTSHPLLEMHSENGQWQLDRLFAPLKQGYVEAYGQLQLDRISKPWQATLSADGLPISVLLAQLPLPVDVKALSSLEIRAKGLAGDWEMLSHSLSGEVQARLFDAHTPFDQGNIVPLQVSDIRLQMARGKLTLAPVTLQGPDLLGSIGGSGDLTEIDSGGISYQLMVGCQQLTGELFSDQHQRINRCEEAIPTSTPHTETGEADSTAP